MQGASTPGQSQAGLAESANLPRLYRPVRMPILQRTTNLLIVCAYSRLISNHCYYDEIVGLLSHLPFRTVIAEGRRLVLPNVFCAAWVTFGTSLFCSPSNQAVGRRTVLRAGIQ